jgi:hypothetical protein
MTLALLKRKKEEMKVLTRSLLVIAALLLFVGTVTAADKLDVRYTYSAPSDGDLEDEVSQHEFAAGIMFPWLTVEDNGFNAAIGGFYQANVWSFDDDGVDDFDLHKIGVHGTVGVPVDQQWAVRGGYSIGVQSDFEHVDEEDVRLYAHAMGIYVQSATLQYALGVGFGEEFGEPEAYPIGGVRWQASEALLLNLMFPSPTVSYALSEDWTLFAAGQPTGGEWNVGEEDAEFDLQIRGYRVGAGAEYQIVPGGWLYAMVGGEGGREVSVAVDDEEIVEDYDLDENAFFQIGFRLM